MRTLLFVALALGMPAVARGDCPAGRNAVVVAVDAHRLLLCERGRERARHPIALGAGGVGKRVEGDERTPLGTYGLGRPRPSSSFGWFIPVEYPTDAQRRAGYTGGAVGVHGPPRAFKALGALTVATDWTAGCIALADDATLAEVVRWVRAHPDARVEIE